jgi:3-hydroxyisobutyrate dehydrogenase-like beta-hydroxyacid dehydrogenase
MADAHHGEDGCVAVLGTMLPTAEVVESHLRRGPLDAPIADAKLHKIERGDFAPEFPLEWALKDLDLGA